MAVDTANKRMSAICASQVYQRLSAVPDASIDDGDRYTISFQYSGNAVLPPAVSAFRPGGGIHPPRNRRRLNYA